MSLAQTITVNRSTKQTLLMLGFAAVFVIMAALIPAGLLGSYKAYAQHWLPLIFILSAGCLLLLWHQLPHGYRLTVTQEVEFIIQPDTPTTSTAHWQLQPDSTIWRAVLFLHLKQETGEQKTLLVFPDAIGDDAFRQLYVACHWKMTHLYTGSAEKQ